MLKHHFIHNILKFAVATDAKNKEIWLQPEKIFGIIDILFEIELKKFEKIENELFQQPKERVFFILSIFVYRIYFFKSIHGF